MAAPQPLQQVLPPPPSSFAVFPPMVLTDPVFAGEAVFQPIVVAGQLDLAAVTQVLLERLYGYKQQRPCFIVSSADWLAWDNLWRAVDAIALQWSQPAAYPSAYPGIGATLAAMNVTLQQVLAMQLQMQGDITTIKATMHGMHRDTSRASNHSLGAELCRVLPIEPVPSHVDGRTTPLALPNAAPITSFQALRRINTIADLTQWCGLYQIPVPGNGPPPERKKAMQSAIWTYLTGYTDG